MGIRRDSEQATPLLTNLESHSPSAIYTKANQIGSLKPTTDTSTRNKITTFSTKHRGNTLGMTTGMISEEGIRSVVSINPNQDSILDFTKIEDKNIEEVHFINVVLNHGIKQILGKIEKNDLEKEGGTEKGDIIWYDEETKQ